MRPMLAALLSLTLYMSGARADDELAGVHLVIGDQMRTLWMLTQPSGVLKDVPYEVEFANFLTPAPLFEAAKSGSIDFTVAIDNLILAAVINQTPLKIVATSQDESKRGTAILARAGSDIYSVKDLKGRDVMVSTIKGGTADNLLFGALKEAGLKEDDVKVGYLLRADAFAAFTNNHADVWVTDDPYTARAEQLGARVLRNGEGINHGLTYYAASDAALGDPLKRRALADFVQRLQQAAQWNFAHLPAYSSFYAQNTGLTPEIAQAVLTRRGEVRFKGVDPQTVAYTGELATEYARRKLFKAPESVAPFFDTTLLPPQELAQ